MLDINSILNGNKKPTKKNNQFDIFNLNSKPKPIKDILKDRVTKQQKKVLKSKSIIKKFGDWDKDGVINGLDCKPRNPKKHGTYYRGIDDMELKLLKLKGKLEPRQHRKGKSERIWITKNKDFAKKYGDNLVEMEIDDSKVKIEPGRSKMVYIEKDITPDQIKRVDEDLSNDGYEVE